MPPKLPRSEQLKLDAVTAGVKEVFDSTNGFMCKKGKPLNKKKTIEMVSKASKLDCSKQPRLREHALATMKTLLAEEAFACFKDLSLSRFKTLNDKKGFAAARAALRQYGVDKLKAELVEEGIVSMDTSLLTTGFKPFNVFARIGAGEMSQDTMADENDCLVGSNAEQFVLACNLPANDEHWASDDAKWVGKASMAKHHRFMTTRDLSWIGFNVLTFGIEGERAALEGGLAKLRAMRAAALEYAAKSAVGWSSNVGLFFHVYGHNSVNGLHMHIVDLDWTGPSFAAMVHKNLSVDDAICVLEQELRALPSYTPQQMRAQLTRPYAAVQRDYDATSSRLARGPGLVIELLSPAKAGINHFLRSRIVAAHTAGVKEVAVLECFPPTFTSASNASAKRGDSQENLAIHSSVAVLSASLGLAVHIYGPALPRKERPFVVKEQLVLKRFEQVGGELKEVTDAAATQHLQALCRALGTHDYACKRLSEMPHKASYYADLMVRLPADGEDLSTTQTRVRVAGGNLVREAVDERGTSGTTAGGGDDDAKPNVERHGLQKDYASEVKEEVLAPTSPPGDRMVGELANAAFYLGALQKWPRQMHALANEGSVTAGAERVVLHDTDVCDVDDELKVALDLIRAAVTRTQSAWHYVGLHRSCSKRLYDVVALVGQRLAAANISLIGQVCTSVTMSHISDGGRVVLDEDLNVQLTKQFSGARAM